MNKENRELDDIFELFEITEYYDPVWRPKDIKRFKKQLLQWRKQWGLELVKNVDRVEVIDHTIDVVKGGGRAYVKHEEDIKVDLDLQDDDRTLKIFITKQQIEKEVE